MAGVKTSRSVFQASGFSAAVIMALASTLLIAAPPSPSPSQRMAQARANLAALARGAISLDQLSPDERRDLALLEQLEKSSRKLRTARCLDQETSGRDTPLSYLERRIVDQKCREPGGPSVLPP